MKAIIKIANPENVEVSMTITMTLEAWKRLREEISNIWPGWQLRGMITDMITKAQTQFTSQDEIEK